MKKTKSPGFMTVPEAAQVLGISRNGAYAAAKRYGNTEGAEGLPNLKVGGCFRARWLMRRLGCWGRGDCGG